jgi:hypothetical protein
MSLFPRKDAGIVLNRLQTAYCMGRVFSLAAAE